jgi:WD40 repeat protein
MITDDSQSSQHQHPLAGATAIDSPEAAVSVAIPDHTLIRRIGSGSYGEVWMARSSMGMFRAVKIVYRKAFKDKRPFERELSGIRKFEPISRSHEGFIDVLHAGINESDGYFYYIMELGDDLKTGQNIAPASYIPRTLSRELKPDGKLPIDRCLPLGLGLSQALAELHKHGLVHRDIKPSNIIFVNGAPKLADIGLVADVDEARSYVGTEGFIPPEGPGTPQADIYGLGKVLYEASTGNDRHDFPELPTNWDKEVDHELFVELNEIILQACKTDVRQRYASAADMHADLVLLTNGKSVKRLKLLERRWTRVRNFTIVTAITLVVVAAIAYQVYWQWRTRFEARQRQVGGNVVSGMVAVESGDPVSAIPYFVEALALDIHNPKQEKLHRLRIGTVLSRCPKLEKLIFTKGEIDRITLTPDASQLFCFENYKVATSVDLKTGRNGASISGPIRDISYSPDGKLLVVADSKNAYVRRVSGGAKILVLPHPSTVVRCVFSPDGTHILTGCYDGIARLWNSNTAVVEHEFTGHESMVATAAFSTDGKLVVTGDRSGILQIWNASDGSRRKRIRRSRNWVNFACFSPDGSQVVAAYGDHRACVFDIESGRQIMPDLIHGDIVSTAEFSSDGQYILTAGLDYTARIWRVDTHQPIRPAGVLNHSGRVMHASFTSDGSRVITACDDGTIRIWNLAAAEVPPQPSKSVYSEDGTVVLSREVGRVTAKQIRSGKIFSSWKNDGKSSFQLSENGRFCIVASNCEASTNCSLIEIRDVENASVILTGLKITKLVQAIISNDGRWLVTRLGDDVLQCWDVKSGNAAWPNVKHEKNIISVFMSPNSHAVGIWSEHVVKAWEPATGRELFAPLTHTDAIRYAAFSPDSSLLVTCCADDGLTKCAAQIFEVTNGKPKPYKLSHGDGVLFAAFSPDCRRIVTASEDFTAQVWDVKTGARVIQPLRHLSQVRTAMFTSDGKWIVTASADKTVRIWDVETGKELTPPYCQVWQLNRAQLLVDGLSLLTCDERGTRRVWNLHIENRSVADLTRFLHVLSGGGAIHAPGSLYVATNSFKDEWKHMEAASPDNFRTADSQIIAWHDFEAQSAEVNQSWPAVIFHLKQALLLHPTDESLQLRLKKAEALRDGESQ